MEQDNSIDLAVAHVALGIHDPSGGYSCHAGAMLASLFLHAQGPVCAHVVHNETLTEQNKQMLVSIARQFHKQIRFYPVSLPTEYHALSGHVTQGALFRLLLPELVDVAKIIYLDCDIIVTMDIFQLWRLDLQGRPVAAALDPGIPTFPAAILQRIESTGVALQNYFNSGVMVMDLHTLRQSFQLFRQAIAYLQRYPQSVFHDQDALNRLFQQQYLQLDSRFNKIVCRSEQNEIRQPSIWHYAGGKPWDFYSSELDMLYWKALMLTPWRDQVLNRLAVAFSRTMKLLQQRK